MLVGNATLESEGIFGDFSVKVKTHRFINMVDQSGTELTASVVHSGSIQLLYLGIWQLRL